MKNQKMPLVTVIMNCYNGERYVYQSIESVIKQSYKNWELIFWDNKSNDNSKLLCKKFNDKRIRYFYSKNHFSLYKSRNLAIKKSKGKYITFLDTDDLWKKNKLKTQTDFIEKNKLMICFSNYTPLITNKERKKDLIKKLNFKVTTQNLLNNYNIGLLTVMIHKTILKKNIFNSNYQIIGDFDLFIKLSLKYQIGFIKKSLAIYRIHGSNLSFKRIDLHIKELSLWLKKNQDFFYKKKLDLKEQKKYLLKLKIKKFIKYY